MNLLQETLEILLEIDKKILDISFIGSADGSYECGWFYFKELANREYDEGFGSTEVAEDLVIVFKDGSWLERSEYDGSEWWSYKFTPSPCLHPKEIESIFPEGFNSIIS